MKDIMPQYEWFLRLQELNIAKVKGGKWGFTERYVKSVHEMNSKRHGIIKQMRLAYGFTSTMTTTIVAYPSFHNKENLNGLQGVYIFLINYLKKIKIETPEDIADLVYTAWYLDEHYPTVKETMD